MKLRIGNHAGTVPGSWDEMTVRQYIAMMSGKEQLEILADVSGIDLLQIENTSLDLDPFFIHMAGLIHTAPDLSKRKRKPIQLNGKTIKPGDVGKLSYAQLDRIKRLAIEDNYIESIPVVFAIYIAPSFEKDGLFRSAVLNNLEKDVNNLLIKDVFQWVVFFFKKLRNARKDLRMSSIVFP